MLALLMRPGLPLCRRHRHRRRMQRQRAAMSSTKKILFGSEEILMNKNNANGVC